jgi:hypothetical protein
MLASRSSPAPGERLPAALGGVGGVPRAHRTRARGAGTAAPVRCRARARPPGTPRAPRQPPQPRSGPPVTPTRSDTAPRWRQQRVSDDVGRDAAPVPDASASAAPRAGGTSPPPPGSPLEEQRKASFTAGCAPSWADPSWHPKAAVAGKSGGTGVFIPGGARLVAGSAGSGSSQGSAPGLGARPPAPTSPAPAARSPPGGRGGPRGADWAAPLLGVLPGAYGTPPTSDAAAPIKFVPLRGRRPSAGASSSTASRASPPGAESCIGSFSTRRSRGAAGGSRCASAEPQAADAGGAAPGDAAGSAAAAAAAAVDAAAQALAAAQAATAAATGQGGAAAAGTDALQLQLALLQLQQQQLQLQQLQRQQELQKLQQEALLQSMLAVGACAAPAPGLAPPPQLAAAGLAAPRGARTLAPPMLASCDSLWSTSSLLQLLNADQLAGGSLHSLAELPAVGSEPLNPALSSSLNGNLYSPQDMCAAASATLPKLDALLLPDTMGLLDQSAPLPGGAAAAAAEARRRAREAASAPLPMLRSAEDEMVVGAFNLRPTFTDW